jgi:hypothetical protein
VDDRRHDGPVRGAVAPQLIGYQAPRFTSLVFQQPTKEAFRCTLIATGQNIDYVSILVNRAPDILSLALDSHEEFVQVPSVTQAALSSLECPGVLGAELLTPLSDGLVGDYDPGLRQKVFNISEAQAESVIEPDGMADNIRRKSVSLIGWCIGVHWPSLPAVAST